MTERGLYLGKFAPFHNGHQHVVETALDEVDELVILIYDTDVIDVPLTVRADWIRTLYPDNVEVLEAWTAPKESGYTEEIKRKHEEYIINRIGERNIDRFYSSERYGDHVSSALDAEDRRVDPSRDTVPISGTKIRENPYKNREYVEPVVYRDLITSVCVMGGPSTGKSTLVEQLADTYDSEYMHEYGREYWEEHHDENNRLAPDELVELATRHREKELERVINADEYFFIDSDAIYTWAFSKYYHDYVPPQLAELARQSAEKYDFHIVCDMDIPFEDDPGREGEQNRLRLQKMTLDYLNRHNIPYYVVDGRVSDRVEQVEKILQTVERYNSEQFL